MKKKSKRMWTLEEEQRLIKLSEKYSQRTIAKNLNRSVASVKGKRIRMKIDCFTDQTDKLNITQISELTGIHNGSISKTWRKYGLRFRKENNFAITTEKQLIEFMRSHPELWKAADCDYYFFYRFDWFMEKLEKEKSEEIQLSHYRSRRPWTELDISRFKMLKSRGLTHNEIAAELGRTKRAIDHINIRLNNYNSNVV